MGEPNVLVVGSKCENQEGLQADDETLFGLAAREKGNYRNGEYVPGYMYQSLLTVWGETLLPHMGECKPDNNPCSFGRAEGQEHQAGGISGHYGIPRVNGDFSTP